MAPYLEHANITVASIDKAAEFLSAAFPHFAIRGSGETVRDFARWRWAHIGDGRFYIALQETVHQWVTISRVMRRRLSANLSVAGDSELWAR